MRRLYLENPLVVDSRTSALQNTALTSAAFYADKKTVQVLIEELGMNETITGYWERNCFLTAASSTVNGNRKEILFYLNSKFPALKFSQDKSKNNALLLAVRFVDKERVQFLIEKLGMDESVTGLNGYNCFLFAARYAKVEILRYLNSKFPDLKNGVADDGKTALTTAARFGDLKTVQYFIEELGVDETITGYFGRNCFLTAVTSKNQTIEKLIYLNTKFPTLKYGKDDATNTALLLAVRFGDIGTVQFLIERLDMDESETGYKGYNSFLYAAKEGKVEILQYLNYEFPTLKNSRDEYGNSALEIARRKNQSAAIRYLQSI